MTFNPVVGKREMQNACQNGAGCIILNDRAAQCPGFHLERAGLLLVSNFSRKIDGERFLSQPTDFIKKEKNISCLTGKQQGIKITII